VGAPPPLVHTLGSYGCCEGHRQNHLVVGGAKTEGTQLATLLSSVGKHAATHGVAVQGLPAAARLHMT